MPAQEVVQYTALTAAQFGALLRTTRKAQGLTLAQLSGVSGFGMRFLSELERGKPTAELGKSLQVAALLGLDCHLIPRSNQQAASADFYSDVSG